MVEDPDPAGHPSPWRTYQECLRRALADGADSWVILQDDAIPCEGFTPAAAAALRAKPGSLVAFHVQDFIQRSKLPFLRAHDAGQRWCLLHRNDWVPAVALGWHRAVAECCLEWGESTGRARRARADDGLLAEFVRACGLQTWATVPSLVEHPNDAGSLMGSRNLRHALLMQSGVAPVEGWSAA